MAVITLPSSAWFDDVDSQVLAFVFADSLVAGFSLGFLERAAFPFL